jgi:amino acid permease
VLFSGVIVSFFAVLAALIPGAHVEALAAHSDWHAVPRAVPTLLLSCVFHNIVGSVAARLQSAERVRNVIFLGSGVPLAMFVAAKYV